MQLGMFSDTSWQSTLLTNNIQSQREIWEKFVLSYNGDKNQSFTMKTMIYIIIHTWKLKPQQIILQYVDNIFKQTYQSL